MDFDKSEPGACGCGVFGEKDSDGDGVVDCKDECPHEPGTRAGVCGCGVPEDTRLCLVHRYSFDGAAGSSTTKDSVGTANGTLAHVVLPGDGTLALAGGQTNQYVELPSPIVSSLGDNVTIEAWVRWTGGDSWQRVFDFGDGVTTETGQPGDKGLTYLFLSPMAPPQDMIRTALTMKGHDHETVVDSSAALPSGDSTFTHLAVVVDGTAKTLALYRDGELENSSPLNGKKLSLLHDLNNCIGRSQFAADPGFSGVITEFRIYSAARSGAQILAATNAGPDVLPPQ